MARSVSINHLEIRPQKAEECPSFPRRLARWPRGRSGYHDPEVVIDRALRFPGEREREVRLALGELLSYLAIDLLNHPKIENPEEFLEVVEDLRAAL